MTTNEGTFSLIREVGTEWAKNTYKEKFRDSSIADNFGVFPGFKKDQLKLGKVLGKGSFGTVYELGGIYMDKMRKTSVKNYEEAEFIAQNCLRDGSGDARYAIKFLSPEVVSDNALFINGIVDFATETRVLSDTEHPNIVKARAFALSSPFDEGYFIMMDRLYDTMEKRIEKWARKSNRCAGLNGKVFDRKGEKKRELWEARLVTAFDLSDALGYLHTKNIVYRDIKPENIGFDVRDDVKLFDFGLAVEMKGSRKTDDGLYNFTGMTGTPRYMSPEVANKEHYNEKCDVYSFAILLWEMLALKTPFEVYTMSKFHQVVWNGEQKRPYAQPSWPEPIKLLLHNAWSRDVNSRPNFARITQELRKQCVVARKGNDKGLEHLKRRSTKFFDRSALPRSSVFSTISSRASFASSFASAR